jgi:hypothetical protein
MEKFRSKLDSYDYEDFEGAFDMREYPCMGEPCPYYRMSDEYNRHTRASGSWGMGAMDIGWNVSFNHIKVEVKLADTIVAQGILTPANAVLAAAGSAGGFSINIVLKADFTAPKLLLSGKLCGPVVGCVDFNSRQVTTW